MFRPIALATVALALAGTLVIQTADPARAAGDGSVIDYALTLPGELLYSQNTDAAKAAWQGNKNAHAAQSATRWNLAAALTNVTPAELAPVIPINSPRLSEPLTPTRWEQLKSNIKSLAVPVTGSQPGVKPRLDGALTQIGVGTAFMFRADIANGVIGWSGVDVNGLVCGDPVASEGFVNFLTGQDCTMFKQSEAFADQINGDVNPGIVGPEICNEYGCLSLMGTAIAAFSSTNIQEHFCFAQKKANGDPGAVGLWYRIAPGQPWQQAINTVTSDRPVRSSNATQPETFPQPQTNAADTCARAGMVQSPGVSVTGGYHIQRATYPDATIYEYAPGTSQNPPTTGALAVSLDDDPERYIECKVTWSSGHITRTNTHNFRESDGAFPDPNCADAPVSGALPAHITLTVKGEGLEDYVYFDQEQDSRAAAFLTENEECVDHVCVLDVVRTDSGLSCFSPSVTVSCADWFHDPNRDANYKCEYGGRERPMQSCYVYANVFNADKRAAGLAYVDPLTGLEPVGAGSTSVPSDVYAMRNPVRPGGAAEARNCWGGPLSANPVDWVLRPIQCAAEWAFVPRPSVVESAQASLAASYAATPAGQISNVVGSWALAPAFTGCAIYFTHWETGQSLPVVDACPGSLFAPLAEISRGISVVAAAVLAVSLIRRQIAGTVDYKGN